MPAEKQGITHDRYLLVPRTLIFLTREKEILLLKGAPHKRIWANRYNGIGGHIERGEDVLSAARRELFEETGLSHENLWLCGTIAVDTGGEIGVGIYVFRGECFTGEPSPSPEGTLEWVSVSRLQELPLVEDLPVLLPRVLAQTPSDPPFSAYSKYNKQGELVLLFSN